MGGVPNTRTCGGGELVPNGAVLIVKMQKMG